MMYKALISIKTMKRVMEPKITFRYLDNPTSEAHLKTAYWRLFRLARRNLLRRKQMLGIDYLHTYEPIPVKKRKIRIINPVLCDENIRIYG